MGTSGEIQHRAEELDCCVSVPDLITEEEKTQLLEIWNWIKSNYLIEYQRDTYPGYMLNGVYSSDIWCNWRSKDRRYVVSLAQRYPHPQPKLLTASLVVIHKGGIGAKKHIDKHPGRRCVVSIPLQTESPILFYENENSTEPMVSVKYDTPMLLNVGQKYHSVPSSDKDRVMLQLIYGETYQTMKKRFEEWGQSI